MPAGPRPRFAWYATRCCAKRPSSTRRSLRSPSTASSAAGRPKPRATRRSASSRAPWSRRFRSFRAASRAARGSSGAASAAGSGFRRLTGDRGDHRAAHRQQAGTERRLDLRGDLRMLDEVVARVVLALADALAFVRVPGAGLLDDAVHRAHVDELALARNALAVEDLELGLTEWRRDLVLHHFYAGLVADDFLAVLQRADAADVEPERRIELERVAAGRRLGVAEHHADLHADLVDEDDDGVRALDVAGELPERLRHQAGVQADLQLAHLALDLGLRREGRDRVDDDDVDRAGAHEHVGDLERLLAGVRLGDQELLDVDAELLGVDGIERVLRVHECGDAAQLLGLRDDRQRQRRLARGLRAVDLDHAAARHAADAERHVEAERSGRYDFDVGIGRVLAEAHHGTLAELFLDLAERGAQRLLAVAVFHAVCSSELVPIIPQPARFAAVKYFDNAEIVSGPARHGWQCAEAGGSAGDPGGDGHL